MFKPIQLPIIITVLLLAACGDSSSTKVIVSSKEVNSEPTTEQPEAQQNPEVQPDSGSNTAPETETEMVAGTMSDTEPETEEPVTEEPVTEEPVTEEPTTEEPTTEGPTTEGPTTEGPTTEGPTTEGPTTEGPTTEGPTTEGPTTEGPTTEGPTTEGPTTEGPTTEGPEQPPGQPEGPEGPATEGNPIPGEELLGDTVVENFVATQGVSVDITRYGVSPSGIPQIELKLNNNSPAAVSDSTCEINALQDNVIKAVVNIPFANSDPIDSGESAINGGDIVELGDGFASIGTIRIGCEWSDGDKGRKDIVSGAVTVDFNSYSMNLNNPTVQLLLTNNSSETITNAICGVEAKRKNVIVDVAMVDFADLGDIGSGEAIDGVGIWLKLSSLNEFESEPFDIANVNCRYQ